MPLEESRKATQSLLLSSFADEQTIVKSAKQWFEDYKAWEKEETFDRAFSEGRMTARVAKVGEQGGKPASFPVRGSDGKMHQIKLASTVFGLPKFLDPSNFLTKKKNELGLHDFSAVLLRPSAALSAQLFAKEGGTIFMPLPLDADLRLVHYLGAAAKKSKAGPLHQFYVEVKNSMTRLKFGSPEDMSNGFFMLDKGDGKEHVRYGIANILGNPFDNQYLLERAENALNYKSKIVDVATKGGNNEVTVKYRQHAGMFPVIGSHASAFPKEVLPQLPVKLDKTDYLIADFNKPIGKVTDAGKFIPV